MASVPVVAVLLARAAGGGVTLWVALAAVGIVFGAGLLAYLLKGAAQGDAGPALPSPDRVSDPRILLLIAGVFVLAGALAARSAPAAGPGGTAAASGGDARPGTGAGTAGPAGSTPAAAGSAGSTPATAG